MVAQECAGMYGLVLACAGIVLAYVGMFGNVQSCAELFSLFEPIHTHPIGALQLVGTCGRHRRLVRPWRNRIGGKLPAAPANFLPTEH